MGLDITAYRGLTKVEDREEADFIVGFALIGWVEWPGRTAGLERGAVYASTDRFGFAAGSYGNYNAWREELAQMAGYPLGHYEQYGKQWPSYAVACWNGAQGPFAELINFADNEGMIGPVVAAKLLKDFEEHEARAMQWAQGLGDDEAWFIEKYRDWRKAFTYAADNGAVNFN
jgi:hypothetical protein